MEDNCECKTIRLILPTERAEIEFPQVNLDTTVLQLKEQLEGEEEALTASRQRLIWGGRQLADSEILRNVFKKCLSEQSFTMHVTLRRAAGSMSPSGSPLTRTMTSPSYTSPSPSSDGNEMHRSYSAPLPARQRAPSDDASSMAPTATPAASSEPTHMNSSTPTRETQVLPQGVSDSKPSADELNDHTTNPAHAMQQYLLGQAYWQSMMQYGMILTHASQLGLEVPFGAELFSDANVGSQHTPAQAEDAHVGREDQQAQQNPLLAEPLNAEEQELNAQIAEFERPGMGQHLQLAFKLILFILLIGKNMENDGGYERFLMICFLAAVIFVFQSGLFAWFMKFLNLGQQNADVPEQPRAPLQYEGVWGEVWLFFLGFFGSMFPNWQPPEFAPPPAPAEDQGGQALGENGDQGEEDGAAGAANIAGDCNGEDGASSGEEAVGRDESGIGGPDPAASDSPDDAELR